MTSGTPGLSASRCAGRHRGPVAAGMRGEPAGGGRHDRHRHGQGHAIPNAHGGDQSLCNGARALPRLFAIVISWIERFSMVGNHKSLVSSAKRRPPGAARTIQSLTRTTRICLSRQFRESLQGKPTLGAPRTISRDPARVSAELRPGAQWLLINLKGSIGYLADPRPAPVSFTAESIACARYSAGSLPKARRKTREKLLRLA